MGKGMGSPFATLHQPLPVTRVDGFLTGNPYGFFFSVEDIVSTKCNYRYFNTCVVPSDFPARLGPEAGHLAWLLVAQA
jgi:hypothetical protein